MTVRHELRGLLADHLRSWSVTLQGWAFRLDPDERRIGPLVAMHLDAQQMVEQREALDALRRGSLNVAPVSVTTAFDPLSQVGGIPPPDPAKRPPGLPPRSRPDEDIEYGPRP